LAGQVVPSTTMFGGGSARAKEIKNKMHNENIVRNFIFFGLYI
jgi:hypothetical protein